jgi:transposase
MARRISKDLRQRVVHAYGRGRVTYAEVADRYSVGIASVSRWLRCHRETGDVRGKPHGGGQKRRIGPEDDRILDKLVISHPDWTEEEYAKKLSEELGRPLKASTVGRAIRRLGYGVKKRPSLPASETVPKSGEDANNTPQTSHPSPLRVWFLWTKRASRRR